MARLLVGLDIGGANIKGASIPYSLADTSMRCHRTIKKFFPLWKNSVPALRDALIDVLTELIDPRESTGGSGSIHVAASITGELSDAFETKNEGIATITGALVDACSSVARRTGVAVEGPLFLATSGELLDAKDATRRYRDISAANWYATAAWISALPGVTGENLILMDSGSTTTDIIPVIGGEVRARGKTDLERLVSGELVYTGVLRATIPSVAHEVPVDGRLVPISFEKFALMADVHFLLGHLSEEQYDCETADGRPVTREHCLRRLGRVVCEDADFLGYETVMEIARYLYEAQLNQVNAGFTRVLDRLTREEGVEREKIICVATGLGERCIVARVAAMHGLECRALSSVVGVKSTISSSAVAMLHQLLNRINRGKTG